MTWRSAFTQLSHSSLDNAAHTYTHLLNKLTWQQKKTHDFRIRVERVCDGVCDGVCECV